MEMVGRDRRVYAIPANDSVTIVSGNEAVVLTGHPIASAIISSALEAGLTVGGRRIVIQLEPVGD